MKIKVDDLKKALDWLRTNSSDEFIDIQLHPRNIVLSFNDKYQSSVEVKLYEDSSMLPKIRKENPL